MSGYSDDGLRVWVNYTPGCEVDPNNASDYLYSGEYASNRNININASSRCLVLDNWRNNAGNSRTATRTFLPGTYTIQVDYLLYGGNARLNFVMQPTTFDDPTFGGTYMPPNTWQFRTYDLSDYAGAPQFNNVAIRFRLDRLNETGQNSSTQNPYNWLNSWWISDITIVDP